MKALNDCFNPPHQEQNKAATHGVESLWTGFNIWCSFQSIDLGFNETFDKAQKASVCGMMLVCDDLISAAMLQVV